MRSRLRNIAFTLMMFGIAFTVATAAEAEPPDTLLLRGVCFSPFRAHQSPDCMVLPSRAEILEDIVFVKRSGIANRLRTYSCMGTLGDIPAMCDSLGMECWPGAWLSGYSRPTEREVQALIAMGKRRPINVPVLIVGNEVLLRQEMTETQLIEVIERVKQETGLQVAYADIPAQLLSHPNVVDAVDVVLVHLYPYWEAKAIGVAVPTLVEQWRHIRATYPGKRIVIGETGWPTAGETVGSAVPSPGNQARYFREFLEVSRSEGIEFFYFALFSESWKAKQEGTRGAHWGIFSESGRLNPDLMPLVLAPVAKGMKRTPGTTPPLQALELPAFIYLDGGAAENRFVPSNWMGDVDALKLDEHCTREPHAGGECLKLAYSARGAKRWAGIYWVGPFINHWGDYPGYIVHGAKRLTFWARGAVGNEIVEFKVGGINSPGKPYRDSFGPLPSDGRADSLTTQWAQYSIDLRGANTSLLLGGFAVVMSALGNPRGCTVYLDDIVITGEGAGGAEDR